MSSQDRPNLVKAYTVILFTLSGLGLLMVISHVFLIRLMESEGADQLAILVLQFCQWIEAVYFVFGIVVGLLRVYHSPLARPLTMALSILLIIWPPFGTAAFVYWLGWVRRRERGEPVRGGC